MKKVIKLKESDLQRIVKRVLNEQQEVWRTDDRLWSKTKQTFTKLKGVLKNHKIVGDLLSSIEWSSTFDGGKYLWMGNGSKESTAPKLGEVEIQFSAMDPYKLHISMRRLNPKYRHTSEEFTITDFVGDPDVQNSFGELLQDMYKKVT